MRVLGIECTAHTISVGIFDNGIKANEIATHPFTSQGLIPRSLADHHVNNFSDVLRRALSKSSLSLEDIDLIAVSQGPGIGAPLSVGIAAAKYLALRLNKPLIGVNHPLAHVMITEYLCKTSDPLILYLSGGNSQIIVKKAPFDYRVLGETLDIGMGNLFDSFARYLKLEPAHGGALEKIAVKGRYVPLPYTVKGLNLVFSGLFTAAKKKLENASKEDVAFSLMETAFSMSCEATERALFLTGKKELIVCGGVAQNRRLQQMLSVLCEDISVRFCVAEDQFNRDNGAMIAYTGLKLFERFGGMNVETFTPLPSYRIDQVLSIHSSSGARPNS